jgi:membrane-associated phospholipid phosphatase
LEDRKMTVHFKKWRPLFGLYVLIYLPWFFYLERTITADTPDMHMVDLAFDHAIPFCEYFVIPYYFWFVYVVGTCIFLMIYGTNGEFIRMALSLIIGMSVCLFICMIYPNGLELRPDTIPDNFCGKLVASLYAVDTSFNVFPSIHVYNSIVVHIALYRCEALREHRIIRISSLVVCILICLSTMFLKQHSVTDVFGACVLSFAMYLVLYVADYGRLRREQSESRRARA